MTKLYREQSRHLGLFLDFQTGLSEPQETAAIFVITYCAAKSYDERQKERKRQTEGKQRRKEWKVQKKESSKD